MQDWDALIVLMVVRLHRDAIRGVDLLMLPLKSPARLSVSE